MSSHIGAHARAVKKDWHNPFLPTRTWEKWEKWEKAQNLLLISQCGCKQMRHNRKTEWKKEEVFAW